MKKSSPARVPRAVKKTALAQALTAVIKDAVAVTPLLRLDLGCGKNKREGFFGLDNLTFDAVDAKVDLRGRFWDLTTVYHPEKLPVKLVKKSLKGTTQVWDHALPDACVDEAHCSHFIEHLKWPERVLFINELYRVLKDGAKCQLILPHWASARYYGDPTHQAPMSEWGFFYWDETWRREQAPGAFTDEVPPYECNFNTTYGYNLHPEIALKNQEYQMYALKFYKDAAQDIIATLEKRPRLP